MRACRGQARRAITDEPLNPFDVSNSRASTEPVDSQASPARSSRRTPSSDAREGAAAAAAAAGGSRVGPIGAGAAAGAAAAVSSTSGSGAVGGAGGSGARAAETPPMTPTRTVAAVLSSSAGQPQDKDMYQSDERMQKFLRLMNSASLDLDALRTLSWSGIPANVRPTAWRLLSGYLPANVDRRSGVLERRRAEYRGFVDQHYPGRHERNNVREQMSGSFGLLCLVMLFKFLNFTADFCRKFPLACSFGCATGTNAASGAGRY